VLRMFGLLRLPNFAKPFIAGFALTNFAYLGVKILESFALRRGRDLDGALLWNQRHLVVGVLICCAIKHRPAWLANGHIVKAPVRLEQDAVTIFRAAVYERDQQ